MSGHLFFHKVRSGLFKSVPGEALVHTDSESKLNYLACRSIVDWKDFHEVLASNGEYEVVLACKYVIGSEEIVGSIYVTSTKHESIADHPAALLSRKINDHSIRTGKAFRAKLFEVAAEQNLNTIAAFDELIKNREKLRGDKHWEVSFKVNRMGFAWFKASVDSELDPNQAGTLIRQCFYFAKYTWHSHKHHEESEDNLTTVIEVQGKSDEEIAKQLIVSLNASLVDINRYGALRVGDKSNGLGIIAYCSSLISSCRSIGWINDAECNLQLAYLLSIGDSIRAQYADIDRQAEALSQRRDNVRNWLLFVLTCIAPSILIYRTKIQDVIQNHTKENDIFLRYFDSAFGLEFFGLHWGPIVFTLTVFGCFLVLLFISKFRHFFAVTSVGERALATHESLTTARQVLKTVVFGIVSLVALIVGIILIL